MQWSAETAMRQMWREMDKNVSNGEMMRFFQKHLQAAYVAGRNDALYQIEAGEPLSNQQISELGKVS